MEDTIQVPDRMVRLAVDFVNTRTRDPEKLTSPEALAEFLAAHGERPGELSERDLADAVAMRERLRPVFSSSPPDAAAILNGLLADYAVRPYLSAHDDHPWHLHIAHDDATWSEWLGAVCALGLAGFAAAHGFDAIQTCAAGDCERVFVNPAARRPRRFCTPTCASRTRVASYRARHR